MRVRNVLVPVDFSPPSRLAVDYGVAIARSFHANLILLHVITPMSESVDGNERHEAMRRMNALVSPEDQGDLNLQVIARVGTFEDVMLDVIRDAGIGMVVMGTHGRGMLGRMFIGSETERMLRKMKTPVLTVSHAPAGLRLNRILVATDLSEESEQALRFAVDLAVGGESSITVLHAVDYAAGRLDEWAQGRLDAMVEKVPARGVKIDAMLVRGNPAAKILDVAGEYGVDLIVLGIERRRLLERALLGTTAERVVREAHIPVLSVPVDGTATAAWEKQAC
jgi:nucleotide-binding universal stress UspA family protein